MGSEISVPGGVPTYFTIGTHFIHCKYRPFKRKLFAYSNGENKELIQSPFSHEISWMRSWT